jgi:hypothetical protein
MTGSMGASQSKCTIGRRTICAAVRLTFVGGSRKCGPLRPFLSVTVRDAIDLMDLTSRAADLFAVPPLDEQQRFLRLLLKAGSWKDRQLREQFDDPFEALRCSNQTKPNQSEGDTMPQPETEVWLPTETRRTRLRRRFYLNYRLSKGDTGERGRKPSLCRESLLRYRHCENGSEGNPNQTALERLLRP